MGAVLVLLGLFLVAASCEPPGPPAFVQQAAAHAFDRPSLGVSLGADVVAGHRLVVEVGVWSAGAATTSAVSDSAGNTYVLLSRFTASEHTEMSIWSAPVTAGGGTRPTITATSTAPADIGIAVSEYAGVSAVADASVVDRSSTATGRTTTAGTVSSGATGATSVANGLAIGFYADSGFGSTLGPGPGFTARSNISGAGDMDLLTEDAVVAAGATPAATFTTGASTTWLAAIVVLRPVSSTATAPAPPTGVAAVPANGAASVTWDVPADGGAAITSYTVTPQVGGVSQPATVVSGSPPPHAATINGLQNGTAYRFTVSATNRVGTSPASAPSNAVTPGTAPLGRWSSLQSMPITALSNILMKDGRFLSWDGWQEPQPSVIWDPAAPGSFTTVDAPDSVFCDGAVALADGRIAVVGGYGGLSTGQIGIASTNIFDPTTSTWSRAADMAHPRWYPSVTELADGRLVTISGNSTDAAHWADTPEVYDPVADTWTPLTGVSTSQVHEVEYPFSYLAPNGKVFTIGPSEDLSFLLDASNRTWTPVGGRSGIRNGSSIMYRPGKVLYTGGAPDIANPTPSSTSAATIDLGAATPTWTPAAPMTTSRIYHTLTMLADGRVFAVGGSGTSDQDVVLDGKLPTEIWDPATGMWTPQAPLNVARNYHSTAVLMPDGRVMVTGGGHVENLSGPGQFSSEIFSPSYLFAGPRPTITSAPSTASYGSTMRITTPNASSIASVNLVSLGADTHQLDMGQHFVPLSFTSAAGALTVSTPSSGALAPPGTYMVFIVDGTGVPSTAAMVTLGAAPGVPSAPTGVQAIAGNGSASVSWSAPANGGSPITSYRVTPFVGSVAQPPTTVVGNPPATTATVNGLANGNPVTFTVTATNAVGTGPPSVPSAAVTPTAPTPPAAPVGVAAVPGNGSAVVSWTAPTTGGSPITSYTVTPYLGTVAQTPTTVAGAPPASAATVTGLTNGSSYTFVVTATNAVGTGPPSAPSNAVTPVPMATPQFVQQAAARRNGAATASVIPTAPVTTGNRMLVEVGVWSASQATTSSVRDSAGNAYALLTRFAASDHTELSVWSAPVSAGGGTRPTITATTTSPADIGVAANEYAGLAPGGGTAVLDRVATATGTTTSARAVSSGSTAPTAVGGSLAVGLYADSGFGATLTGGPGYAVRTNVSPTNDMELLVEDALVGAGSTPAASIGTGASTTWLAATLVLKPATVAAPTAPAAPTAGQVTENGDGTATLTWSAPFDGGSPTTAYTITPIVDSIPRPPITIRPRATAASRSRPSTASTGPSGLRRSVLDAAAYCLLRSPTRMGMAAATLPATTATVAGLRPGQPVSFTVTATNAAGTGAPSRPFTPDTG